MRCKYFFIFPLRIQRLRRESRSYLSSHSEKFVFLTIVTCGLSNAISTIHCWENAVPCVYYYFSVYHFKTLNFKLVHHQLHHQNIFENTMKCLYTKGCQYLSFWWNSMPVMTYLGPLIDYKDETIREGCFFIKVRRYPQKQLHLAILILSIDNLGIRQISKTHFFLLLHRHTQMWLCVRHSELSSVSLRENCHTL